MDCYLYEILGECGINMTTTHIRCLAAMVKILRAVDPAHYLPFAPIVERWKEELSELLLGL